MDRDFEGHDQLTNLGLITYHGIRFSLNLSISELDAQDPSRRENTMTCPPKTV